MTDREKIAATADLVARWRDRCLELAKQGKFLEAAQLHEAANEVHAILGANPYAHEPERLTTDEMVRDAYEKARRQQHPPISIPTIWPAAPTEWIRQRWPMFPPFTVTD